jgi:hypothetical protein
MLIEPDVPQSTLEPPYDLAALRVLVADVRHPGFFVRAKVSGLRRRWELTEHEPPSGDD